MELKINKSFKELIPPLSVEEFQTLESNVLHDGIREPLVVWNKTLIDGHNRYEIAKKHNLHIPTVEYQFDSEEDAKAWIINNQLGRRNLTPAIRIELALQLEPLIQKKAKENLHFADGGDRRSNKFNQGCQKSDKVEKVTETIDTKKEIAKIAGVSHDTVSKYKKVKEKATPELLEQVKSGEKKINTAFREIQVGTRICSICKMEKSVSDFPANGATFCRDCQNKRRTEQRKSKRTPLQYDEDGEPIMNDTSKETVAAVEKWMHRPTPTMTDKIRALEVVDGFGYQFNTYSTKLLSALEKLKKSEERKEVIDELKIHANKLNNFIKELENNEK